MGIAGFWSWLVETYPLGFVSIPSEGVVKAEHVLIDLNGILHVSARKAKTMDQLISVVFSKLNKLLNRFFALKTVFLALDGPASSAKVKTQKQRRESTMKKRTEAEETLNTCMITPGTPMMEKFKDALLFYCCQRLQNTKKYGNIQFILSGADAAGEGEVKLISWILEHQMDHDPFDRYLVIGSDADLVLLTLGTLNRNIYLLHDKNDLAFFSTYEFMTHIDSLCSHPTPTMAWDFVLISLLQGNDYLPKMRKATMDLWPSYLTLRKTPEFLYSSLFKFDYTINWPFFLKLLSSFSKSISKLLTNSATPFVPPEDYHKYVSKVKNYIGGLQWCMYMYTTGSCADYSFCYPDNVSPTPRQLCTYYLTNRSKKTLSWSSQLKVIPKSKPLAPILFSLTILPLQAKDCFIPPIQALITDGSAIYEMLSSSESGDIEAVKQEISQIPVEQLTRTQRSQITQCAASIILMVQDNHSLPKQKSFQLQIPNPPVARFSKLRTRPAIRALHFNLGNRRNLPKL